MMFRGSPLKRQCTRAEAPEIFSFHCQQCAIEVCANSLRVLATITQRVLGEDGHFYWLCGDCPGESVDSDDDSAAETQPPTPPPPEF